MLADLGDEALEVCAVIGRRYVLVARLLVKALVVGVVEPCAAGTGTMGCHQIGD